MPWGEQNIWHLSSSLQLCCKLASAASYHEASVILYIYVNLAQLEVWTREPPAGYSRNIPSRFAYYHCIELKRNKFYSVERKLRHLYSFNSCILYTWVSVEALNNLYKLPLHTPNSQSLWVDLQPSLFLSSLLFDVVFFMGIAAIHMCVAAHGARHT